MIVLKGNLFYLALSFLLLAACDGGDDPVPEINDAGIKAQVEAALSNAADLPQSFSVMVQDGRVTINGSLQCEECGGANTPGNLGTIQQSLGAVVRAIPGVTDVEFSLATTP